MRSWSPKSAVIEAEDSENAARQYVDENLSNANYAVFVGLATSYDLIVYSHGVNSKALAFYNLNFISWRKNEKRKPQIQHDKF